jgi:hypothetical protein
MLMTLVSFVLGTAALVGFFAWVVCRFQVPRR